MASRTWYAVNDNLDIYDTGTGWEYTVRKCSTAPEYVVREYRKSGGMLTNSATAASRAAGKARAMEWAVKR